jgi:hypothetical protein
VGPGGAGWGRVGRRQVGGMGGGGTCNGGLVLDLSRKACVVSE